MSGQDGIRHPAPIGTFPLSYNGDILIKFRQLRSGNIGLPTSAQVNLFVNICQFAHLEKKQKTETEDLKLEEDVFIRKPGIQELDSWILGFLIYDFSRRADHTMRTPPASVIDFNEAVFAPLVFLAFS